MAVLRKVPSNDPSRISRPRSTLFRPVAAPPTVTQEGFRWRVDDGSETTATWAAAQDTNTTLTVGAATRLRVVLDATGDPPAAAYTLYYKKSTDSTWLPVPVGATAGGTLAKYRTFNGTTDLSTWSLGNLSGVSANPQTYVAVCRLRSASADCEIMQAPGYDPVDWFYSTGAIAYYDGGAAAADGPSWTAGTASTDWRLWAVRSRVGSVALWSQSQYNGTSWPTPTHTSATNGTTFGSRSYGTTGVLTMGGLPAMNVDIVCIARFNTNLSDAQINGMTDVAAIQATSGITNLWMFGQATPADLVGTSTLSALTGTTLSSGDSPFPAGGGGGASGPVYVVTSSNVTAGGEATTPQLTAPSGKTASGGITRTDRGRTQNTAWTSGTMSVTGSSFAPAAGSVLVAYVTFDGEAGLTGAPVTTVTDTFGGTGGGSWTQAAICTRGSVGTGQYAAIAAIWYRVIGTGPSSGTITTTVTIGGGTTSAGFFLWFQADELAAANTASLVGGTTGTTGRQAAGPTSFALDLGASPASTSFIATTLHQDNTSTLATVPTGFTQSAGDFNGATSQAAYRNGSGTQTFSWTSADSASNLLASAVEFKAAPGSGDFVTGRMWDDENGVDSVNL